jgi:hypothetical protein
MAMTRIFTQVDYQQFRQLLSNTASRKVKTRGFETTIYDREGDILAIVHAASIDDKGNCHPAEYHVRSASIALCVPMPAAA